MEEGIHIPNKEERERLFNEKMSHLTPDDLDLMREASRKEYDIRKHMGEVTEEADARLLVVGTRYYQKTRADLGTFLQKVRGTRLIIQQDRGCVEDPDAIAAYQVSDDRGFHKVGYIAKEMKGIAKDVIEQSGGKMAFVYVEGAEGTHTSLTVWPVLKGKGVVRKIKRHTFRMPRPSGDIDAIWAFKATDSALELAKFFTGHCTPNEKLFAANLFCRAAAANQRLFGPAAKYLTDDLLLSQEQTNYTIVQNMTISAPMKKAEALAAAQETGTDHKPCFGESYFSSPTFRVAIKKVAAYLREHAGLHWSHVYICLSQHCGLGEMSASQFGSFIENHGGPRAQSVRKDGDYQLTCAEMEREGRAAEALMQFFH